jgi:hypothetical protein
VAKSLADLVREKLDTGVLPVRRPRKDLDLPWKRPPVRGMWSPSSLRSTSPCTTTTARPFDSTRDATPCGMPSCAAVAIFHPSRRRIMGSAHRRKAD